jgi:hypothetical protein
MYGYSRERGVGKTIISNGSGNPGHYRATQAAVHVTPSVILLKLKTSARNVQYLSYNL